MKHYVWVLVSSDEYELVEAVADTIRELAAIAGVSPNTIKSQYNKWIHGNVNTCRYRKVKLEE